MRATNPVPGPTLKPRNRRAWRSWLEEHHATHRGLFLLLAKKHLLERAPGWLTYDEAVDEALCFGWIDGLVKAYHEDWRAIRFTPRRDNSVWSERNKARVERLVREGRMRAPGRERIAAAKANGRWAALEPVDRLSVPTALRAQLRARPAAWSFWVALPPSHRKQWLFWIHEAKRPETKARRIEAVVRECAAARRPGTKRPSAQ